MVGNAKLVIGEAREKFATPIQGGTALNGAQMKAEGTAMDAKEELKNYVDGFNYLGHY